MEETDETVVVVDAPAAASETAAALEAALPVTCLTAANPSELRWLLDDRRIECVVTELVFADPAADGDDAAAQSSADEALSLLEDLSWDDPTLPVVVYTDADVDSLVDGSVLPGATAYVDRDATRADEELAGWVERAVARGEPARRKRISGIAHDLKNPIQAANVYLNAFRRECESQYVEDLAETHEHILALADDLEGLVTAGAAVTDPESVDLESTVRDAWAAVDTDESTLVVDAGGTVQGDQRRLFRLFENLFANAVDHASRAVTVTVGRIDAASDSPEGNSAGDDSAADDSAADDSAGDDPAADDPVADDSAADGPAVDGAGFFVADDGPGIPAENRECVFDRGYTTSEVGTGYGLAIVAELAAAHGWTVTATESESGGARFEFRPK